jgi:hypothetical protein
MGFVDPSIGVPGLRILISFSTDKASLKASSRPKEESMTYPFSQRLFLENGPAILAAAARARRAALDAYYLAERDRLEAARTVTGADFGIAA